MEKKILLSFLSTRFKIKIWREKIVKMEPENLKIYANIFEDSGEIVEENKEMIQIVDGKTLRLRQNLKINKEKNADFSKKIS